jgi:hypothetical protein
VPKLKANFEADWTAHLRGLLTKTWGAQIADIPDAEIPFYHFESPRRRLKPGPRALKIADDFSCSTLDRAGWKGLQDKVRKGEDLNPHLSLRHASLRNADGLLAEWGVHHFHLGTAPHPTNPAYVGRTGPLVFALVDQQTFCAINVFSHDDCWEETRIIESIHRNWPDMVSAYQMNGVTGESLSKPQRRAIRKKNVNVLVTTTDGAVYAPIGGAVGASGLKMESVRRADAWRAEILELHPRVEETLPGLLPVLVQNGYAGQSEIDAELRITEGGYRAFFPRYKILANLTTNPA